MTDPKSPSGSSLARGLVQEMRARLADAHGRIRHCLGQLDDAQVWWRPDEALNSLGNIVLHLCGNVRQWIIRGVRDEPDDRDRPGEFAERNAIPRDELLVRLAAVVGEADAVIATLTDETFLEARRIQGFDEMVLSAVLNSLTHFCGHAQEVIYITRLQLGSRYRFAWAPATPEQGAPA